MYLNSFIGPPMLNNANMSVSGIPGSGKSVFIKLLLMRSRIIPAFDKTRGKRIAVLDAEGEYKKVTEFVGGKSIKIEQGKSAGLNIFDIEPEAKGKKSSETVNILDKISEIRALMATITRNYLNRTLNAKEITNIELIVAKLYQKKAITTDPSSLFEKSNGKIGEKYTIGKVKKKMPTLSEFQKELSRNRDCKELAELLVPFLRGNSLGMFDCQSTINSSTFINFDLSSIKDEFSKSYCSFVILSWIWQKFVLKHQQEDKIVAIDEGWMFIRYEGSAEFLETLARRGRKRNVSFVIGTQFLDELLENAQGKAIINSAPTHLIFRQSPGNIDETINFFNLSNGVKEFLQIAQPGECIFNLNGIATGIKIDMTEFEENFVKS